MNIEMLKITKKYIESVKNNMDIFQEKGYVEMSTDLKLSEIYCYDITDYIMYLIASDENININEVDVYRYLTGFGGDNLDSIKSNIENGDVMSYDFQSKIPLSLILLINTTNRIVLYDDTAPMEDFLKIYVNSYILAGREIISADDRVSYQERRDYELYVKNLVAYIVEHSYVRFTESLTKLLNE